MTKSVFLSILFALLFCEFTENVKGQVVNDYDPFTDGDPILKIPQVRAEFPGGMVELRKFITDNCQYPEAAREAGWQGTVMLEFVVERNGCISNITVLLGVCEALDNEAIRVVKSMPKWKPAENNGQPCRSYFQIPITFSRY